MKLDLDPHIEKEVIKVINLFFDSSTKLFIFGSRMTNTAKKYSDLDICIHEYSESKELIKKKIQQASEAFENSQIPIKIDLSLFSELPDSFQRSILEDHQELDRQKFT